MSQRDFAAIYSDGTYLSKHPDWDADVCPWKAKQIASILSNNSVFPKSICEVGCGSGAILAELSKQYRECRFYGYDISKDAIALAQKFQSSNIEFAVQDLGGITSRFDVILAMDVVEHVEDYYGFLRTMRDRAKYTLIHFPLDLTVSALLRGLLMSQRDLCGHIHYFTKDTALAAMRDTGYEIVDYFYPKTWEISRTGFAKKAAAAVRRASFAVAPDLSSLTLGGYTLMVLAKAR